MKKQKSNNNLTREDRNLWKRVAETTKPLTPQRGAFLRDEMMRLMEDSAPFAPLKKINDSTSPLISNAQSQIQRPVPKVTDPHPLEERLIRNIVKGRRQIDGQIDLHGMTQNRACQALLDYLQQSQGYDRRIVLVITGKGNEGRGVLRRMVPQWLSLPAFLPLVNGYQEAHVGHGGKGALYVRLRRRRK
ncbi:MAG: Smr/MutS family protein [Rhizobiaceae bacterium]